MTIAEQLLVQDFLRYQKMLHALQTKLAKLPKGKITYRTLRGKTYCHLQFRDKDSVHNQPIAKEELEQIQQALQQRIELQNEIKSLQQTLKTLEKTFPQLPTLSATLPIENAPNPNKPYRTAKGDYVRSKSELIIANELFANQIDYQYEKPLSFEGFRYDFYPDFTIYTPQQNQVVYWEHCGLMTDVSYRERWERKKKAYEKNGIADWRKNLIITYESESGDLNLELIDQIIADLLRR